MGERLRSQVRVCRRLILDVCCQCVSRSASVSVARGGMLVACRDLPITYLSFRKSGAAKLGTLGQWETNTFI